MLNKLYEADCFNYAKFIIDNQKKLGLNSDEAMILINILDGYKTSKFLSRDVLLAKTGLTKSKIDKSLNSLLERSFFSFYVSNKDGSIQETITLDGFFIKASLILENKGVNLEDELSRVNEFLTNTFNRILTSNEMEIVQSLVLDDRKMLSDFENAYERIKNRKVINIKMIAQALAMPEAKPNNVPAAVSDFFSKIK